MRLLLAVLLAVLVAVLATAGLTPPGTADTAPSRSGVWPLQPRPPVVEGFDPPVERWGRGHRGVDLGGRPGQVVHAALAGRVTLASTLAGRGVVVVDHGAFRTTYEPVGAQVAVGEVVARGAVLGRLQRAGSHCFPAACLHWGLKQGRSTYLDPLVLVGGGPVRLLPLTAPTTPAGSAPRLPVARLVLALAPGPTRSPPAGARAV